MISFGFISLYPHQENLHATEIAKRAQQFQIQMYRFTPTSIQPTTEQVRGEVFNQQTQEWQKALFEIPTYLYDRCFYSNNDHSKKSKPIMSWLKKRPTCYFLGHGLPNKWDIFQALKKDSILSPYVPVTERATSSGKVIRKLKKEQQLILKPELGSMGKGIFRLFLHKNFVETTYTENQKVLKKQYSNRSDLTKWLDHLFSSQNYLFQPYLPLQDESKRPFDIRILVQKNQQGHWQEAGRGIRRGLPDQIISNIGSGGEILSFDNWISALPKDQQLLLVENIESIINRLPAVLEDAFHPLFELGVDLGMADDGSVWILDSNSKPGRKVILKTSPNYHDDIYSAPLRYCKYLENKLNINI
ncbi:YheC/YheD family protein [Fredinandcohnia quinoae]|uniref:YheC/YheD family protein n=1 Tax=Fredinandcohnia quinoae TaxID=2918902 RepID=A0AAW5E2H1_9BACI|nr:YheC/YheD family protein [Fredinandcohnia sp. SECRCQ15]MCH1627092.1 YheC/YheD family protein [Fredinandcohnia sp. SECRCQ15]